MKIAMYAVLVVAVAVLAWSIYSMVQPAGVQNNAQNFEYYQNQNLQTGSECGDMEDLANVQHLSHHPERFGECIKQVDAGVFEKAVGQSKESYMAANGIQ